MSRPVLMSVLTMVAACAREQPAPARPGTSTHAPAVALAVPPDTTASPTPVARPAAPYADSVTPREIPAEVRATCDTALTVFRAALSLDPRREDGSYYDSFRNARVGCRLSADGSFMTFKGENPTDALIAGFEPLGWHRDTKVDAAGPDGEVLAVRKRTRFCVLTERVAGHDDSDTMPPDTSLAARTAAAWFQAIVECSRDVVANVDEYEVPDSVWRIARDAGLDSVYAFSHREGAFPKTGDFDGDGRQELVVLVEERATDKLGFVVVNPATRRTFVVAAGTRVGACPDDLGNLTGFEVWHPGVLDMAVPYDPRAPLRADAVYVARADSTRFFYFPLGPVWMCEVHPPGESPPERPRVFQRLRRPPD